MSTRECSRIFVATWLVMLLPWFGSAQEDSKVRKGDRERDGLIARVIHLMPPGFAPHLNLTQEQQKSIQKLDQEFKEKRRDALTKTVVKVMSIVESMQAEEDEELAPVLAICHEITGGLLESRRTRMAYEQKMLGVLDVQQKQKFARLKEMSPHERRQQRLDGSEEAAEPPLKGLERLQLTPEQRKRVAELRQEMEMKLRDLLTEEQRQQLDQTKDRGKIKQKPKD
jgi:hypothetical protein